jgi:hypothetical protein
MEELTDDNPDVVREAARAFEKVLGIRPAVTRVVEAASKADPDHMDRYASALRWMNRRSVVEELEAAMVAGPVDHQEGARILLSEMGGAAAFEKLRTRTLATQHATSMLERAEEKIRDLFETSIQEARSGYKLSTYMDIVVFFLGVGLVALSAGHVLYQGGSLDGWMGVGLGLTGGTGILGVVYGTLLANPRRQVQEAVDHLMHLKIIFLAYLRQLHQADQAYTRQLLEDKPLTLQDIEDFSKIVQTTMRLAVEQLTMTKSTALKTRL